MDAVELGDRSQSQKEGQEGKERLLVREDALGAVRSAQLHVQLKRRTRVHMHTRGASLARTEVATRQITVHGRTDAPETGMHAGLGGNGGYMLYRPLASKTQFPQYVPIEGLGEGGREEGAMCDVQRAS
jgi:hypothetical protein